MKIEIQITDDLDREIEFLKDLRMRNYISKSEFVDIIERLVNSTKYGNSAYRRSLANE